MMILVHLSFLHDYIPPRNDKSSHDNDEPLSPPRLPPPQPHDAPGGGPSGKGPQCHSGQERKGTRKEGNVYPPGTSTDTDRHKCLLRYSATSIPNSGQSSNTVVGDPGHAKIAMEGGTLWEYLLSKAISDDELPDLMNVQDWTHKDIGKLSAEDQQAWCKAQFVESEAGKVRDASGDVVMW